MRQSEAANMNLAQSPQKPVNLLPEVPDTANSAGRKLSEREKRDCEVIGKTSVVYNMSQMKWHNYVISFVTLVNILSASCYFIVS